MADTLVERITGRPADVPVPIAVDLVITDDTLLGGDTAAARVPGYGPIPAAVARRLVNRAATDARSRATLRRLYRHPAPVRWWRWNPGPGAFPRGLARFIDLRDDTCRTPYCDAPIRHHDHAVDRRPRRTHHRGQRAGHLRGVQLRQGSPRLAGEQPPRPTNGTHTAEFTTPTGARHQSTAPPLPGRPGTAAASSKSPSPTTSPGTTPPEDASYWSGEGQSFGKWPTRHERKDVHGQRSRGRSTSRASQSALAAVARCRPSPVRAEPSPTPREVLRPARTTGTPPALKSRCPCRRPRRHRH